MAAWSDGIEVHAAEQEGRDIRLDVLLQAALLAAGSLDAAIPLRLIGRPAAARRYLAVEARRAIRRAAGKLPSRPIHDSPLAVLATSSASAAEWLAIAPGKAPVPEPGWSEENNAAHQ